MNTPEFTIDELAREAGTTVRNIAPIRSAGCCRLPNGGGAWASTVRRIWQG